MRERGERVDERNIDEDKMIGEKDIEKIRKWVE